MRWSVSGIEGTCVSYHKVDAMGIFVAKKERKEGRELRLDNRVAYVSVP